MTLENIASRLHNDKNTRRLLELVFHQTRMAMCVTDPNLPDNPIIAINNAFTRLTGYEEDEILGRNCRFLQGKDTDSAEVDRIRQAVDDPAVTYFELLNYKKDGTPFWNALHVGPVYSEEGELLYFFGSQWDVTEKVEAINALEGKIRLRDERLQGAIDEAGRLRHAVDQASDAMLLTEYAPIDAPGPRIVWVNRGMERMSGYSREELIGQTPRIFQGPETDRAVLDEMRAALAAGRAKSNLRTINYRKDGTPYHLEWSIAPIAGQDGAPRYWLSVQRDVTEQVEAARKLRLLTDELNHRHKNVRAVISALQQLLPTEGLTAKEYRDALSTRMRALTAAHEVAFGTRDGDAPADEVARSVLAPFADERLRLEATGSNVASRSVLDMALIVHELATNASKHGALSVPSGRVLVTLRDVGDEVHLDWRESGGPVVRAPERSGFGRTLLKAMTAAGRRTDAGLDFDPSGISYRTSLRKA